MMLNAYWKYNAPAFMYSTLISAYLSLYRKKPQIYTFDKNYNVLHKLCFEQMPTFVICVFYLDSEQNTSL